MTDSIDVLLIEPSLAHAKQTRAAIRKMNTGLSTVRVMEATQAARLMFEQGLFTQAPQMPSLIIVDLPALGADAKRLLLRLKSMRTARPPLIAILSSRRNAKDIVDAHLAGAHLNVLKPENEVEYSAAVERIIRMWLNGSLLRYEAQAC